MPEVSTTTAEQVGNSRKTVPHDWIEIEWDKGRKGIYTPREAKIMAEELNELNKEETKKIAREVLE